MPSMEYNHPQYVTRQFQNMYVPAGSASASIRKWPIHCDTKIKRISGIVNVAGTNAAAGYDIYNGTTSIGAITFGTNSAGSFVAGLTQDIALSSGGFLDIRTKANSATLAVDLNIEFHTVFNGSVT